MPAGKYCIQRKWYKDVVLTLFQRRYNVLTLERRYFNAETTSCAGLVFIEVCIKEFVSGGVVNCTHLKGAISSSVF